MRKLLWGIAVLVLVILAVPAALLVTGTISPTSLRMVLNVMTGAAGPAADEATVAGRYRVPEGFSVSLYAADVPRARFLAVTAAGDLLVSRPHAGDVLLLRADANGDGLPDGREVLLEGLSRPLGLDTHAGWLYVAESNRVGRAPFDAATGTLTGPYDTIIDGLTDNGNHWSKTLRIGPDGRLYLAQGSTCNICEEADERRATMMRFEADGSGGDIIATGLRNSVGFDWSPWDGALYATDNGRDLLGDDFPPCELNRIEDGGYYGWPYFNGDNIPDPDMGADPRAGTRAPVPPVHGFRAHNAPLGITFPDTGDWPREFRRSALVALHGSWNRSEPDGYKVVSLHWTGDAIEERDFLSGFNLDGDISGRPVDVAQGPDGSIFVSDDYAGAIYRITYGAAAAGTPAAPVPVDTPVPVEPEAPAWLEGADLEALATQGALLYREHGCASCHEEGENPRRLDGLVGSRGYARVIDALEAPQAPMPVYPLEDAEKHALAALLVDPD